MPRTSEYCITCGGKLSVVVSFVVENHYELISLDLNAMHGVAESEKITELFHPPSCFVICEKCYDKQSITVEFTNKTTGDTI